MPATKDKASIINNYRPDLAPFEDVYRDIHQIPEPPGPGARTTHIAASDLEGLDRFQAYQGFDDHKAARLLENGPGTVVLLCADMDALPHLENANREYASTKIARNRQGNETLVMLACGHDMHTTSLMAAATLLHAASTTCKGTLICLFQPDEETA